MKEDLRQQIRTEQLRQLFAFTPVSIVANVVNSAILTFVLWKQVVHPVLIGWLLAIAILTLLRFVLYRLYPSHGLPEKAKAWEYGFTIAIAMTGFTWGLSGIILFPTGSVVHQVFIAFVLGGMVAGAAASLSALKRAFFAYSLPALLPITVRFFVMGGDIHVAMGAMALLFGLLMVSTALRIHGTMVSSFALRFENRDLIEKLRHEITVRKQAEEELQRGRDALEAKVRERTGDLSIANKGLAQEIEERIAAENALRDSEGKLRAMLESIAGPMSMIDKDLNVIWTNSIATRLFGEDIVGRKCFEAFHHAEKPCTPYPCITLKAFEDEGVHGHDTQVVDKNGQVKYFRCTANVALRDNQGNPTAVLEISEDITERVRAEEERLKIVAQMQHAQKLESLGVLAGGIAHDFNNLLTSVLGNAGLALRDLPPLSPARNKMRQIEIAAQRGADLTRQMLAYSGKGHFVVIPLDLNELVQEMSYLLRTAIPKRTTLKHRFADNLPAIEADAAQIQQIIMNLITNASDAFIDQSGLVTVSTGVTEVDQDYLMDAHLPDELASGLYVYLEVSDTGIGMDKETQKKMFDPFFTTKTTGRGLGLAAVEGIVRGHKGALKVYSEPGCGTTVKVLLPASQRQAEAPTVEPENSEAWHGTGTILVVDDEEGVRAVIEYVLEANGFTVLTACDGREGVEVFREHSDKIAAVLLDMTMPHMDGATAFSEIHHLRPEVPVILMSGYSEQDATGQFAGKGLAGFIQKPYRPADVIRKLQQVLEP